MNAVYEQFKSSEKALARTLKGNLSSMITGIKSLHECIMQMRNIDAQPKSSYIEISETFLLLFILNSLPSQYVSFKISYNTYKIKFNNCILTMCVQKIK